MHLEIDRKAPPQTYKERSGVEAACALLSSIRQQRAPSVQREKLELPFT